MESLLSYSKDLIQAVKDNRDTEGLMDALAKVKVAELERQLKDDQHRLTFWINVYNAYYQVLRTKIGMERPYIFTQRVIPLARQPWSLDAIEHGILRKYRYKYSLGFFPSLIVAKHVKQNAVRAIDFRIHFALNCGAVSCPPIAVYSIEKLDSQLNEAMRNFIQNESEVNEEQKTIRVSRIFFWFMKDFGGYRGIRKILEDHLDISLRGYKIRFKAYSWTDKLHNFID